MTKYKILATYNVTLEFDVALDFDPRIEDNWCIKYATFYADNNDGSEVEVEPIYEIEDAHDFKYPDSYCVIDYDEQKNI